MWWWQFLVNRCGIQVSGADATAVERLTACDLELFWKLGTSLRFQNGDCAKWRRCKNDEAQPKFAMLIMDSNSSDHSPPLSENAATSWHIWENEISSVSGLNLGKSEHSMFFVKLSPSVVVFFVFVKLQELGRNILGGRCFRVELTAEFWIGLEWRNNGARRSVFWFYIRNSIDSWGFVGTNVVMKRTMGGRTNQILFKHARTNFCCS